MTKLIDGLATLAAERRKRAAKATPKSPVSDKTARANNGAEGASAQVRPAGSGRTSPRADPLPKDADPGSTSGNFARMRGKLSLPVSGNVTGRFGAVRNEGGDQSRWKGLFISAVENTDVRAVAAGTVVFADWMRGFGNLVIVDHDDDFLSIYAYNQSLLKQPGDPVKAGQSLATVGNSGGAAQPGLYFEMRYRGQPFDPGKWLKR